MRIGVTQRVTQVDGRAERRDVLDQAWTRFLQACDLEFVPIPNQLIDPVNYAVELGVGAIVLTGGGNVSDVFVTRSGAFAPVDRMVGDTAPERDRTESLLLNASISLSWPVLGVCRGMQALNLFHGGSLVHVPGHVAVNHPLLVNRADGRWSCPAVVNSFHDFGITAETLGNGLSVVAWAGDTVEAIVHDEFNHCGIMWHPERGEGFSAENIQIFRRMLSGGGAVV